MKRPRLFSAAIVIFILATALGAQKLLLNQAYLNQFPTIDRVRAETKGADAVDSYARYMAALTVINDFMIRDLVAAPNGGEYDMPPAANKVHYRYSNELTRLEIDSPEPPARDPRYRTLRDKYEKDSAFSDMLLQKFFTPQFRADYYAWTRKPMPTALAVKTGGNVGSSGAAGADQSIAKAKAAKVDISLFAGSIRFGDPVNLPSCPYQNNFIGLPQRSDNAPDCLDTMPLAGDLAAAVDIINAMTNTKATAPDPDVHSIYVSAEHRPSWMWGEIVSVRTYQGGIARVVIATKSKDVAKRVEAELAAKYGSVYGVHAGTVTPDTGNPFSVRNLEWSLPGLHVEYKVLEVDENDRVHIDGTGYVRIETDTAYKSRIAEEKKPQKRVL